MEIQGPSQLGHSHFGGVSLKDHFTYLWCPLPCCMSRILLNVRRGFCLQTCQPLHAGCSRLLLPQLLFGCPQRHPDAVEAMGCLHPIQAGFVDPRCPAFSARVICHSASDIRGGGGPAGSPAGSSGGIPTGSPGGIGGNGGRCFGGGGTTTALAFDGGGLQGRYVTTNCFKHVICTIVCVHVSGS